jgi:WD40 repeat protein
MKPLRCIIILTIAWHACCPLAAEVRDPADYQPPTFAGADNFPRVPFLPAERTWERMDIHVSKNATGDRLPCVVSLYGGGWTGKVLWNQRNTQTLLDHGYVVATPDYVLGCQHPRPMAAWDCAAAIRLLRKNAATYRIDPERIECPAADAPASLVLRGHERWVAAVQFSPDGKRIVSGGDDESVKVWDAASGKLLWSARETGSAVTAVAFSHDGRRVVAGRWDGLLNVRDSGDGRLLATLRGHTESITSIAFSPDGKQIASGSGDDTLKVWDADSGEAALDLPSGNEYDVTAVAFSADSRRIVSGDGENRVKIWDAGSGEELAKLDGHGEPISAVACSANGRRVASGSWDRTVKIWDVRGGAALVTLLGHEDEISRLAFSADDARILSASVDGTVKIWDARGGAALATLRLGMEKVTCVAFSADGKRIAAGGSGVLKISELPETR